TGTVLVGGVAFRWSDTDYPPRPLNLNGTLFFAGSGGLWKSDGTEAGTVLVKEITLSSEYSYTKLVNLNGTLFFIGENRSGGGSLWKSDGTTAGTVLVADNVELGAGPANVNGT